MAMAHRQDTFQFNKARDIGRGDRVSVAQQAAEQAAEAKLQGSTVDVNTHQDAIEAFSVVAALVLGFSFSALVAVACELTTQLSSGNPYVGAFCLLMSVATASSGYSAIFFTMEVYYVKRLSDEGGVSASLRVETFLTLVGYRRKLARNATVGALAVDMLAIGGEEARRRRARRRRREEGGRHQEEGPAATRRDPPRPAATRRDPPRPAATRRDPRPCRNASSTARRRIPFGGGCWWLAGFPAFPAVRMPCPHAWLTRAFACATCPSSPHLILCALLQS
jgi:hypothetical protein